MNRTESLSFLFICRNLQAAIGAYYDFESPNISMPSMSFVEDVTIGEGESIPPDTQFIKTWRIQNSGKCIIGNSPCPVFFFFLQLLNKCFRNVIVLLRFFLYMMKHFFTGMMTYVKFWGLKPL